MKRAWDMFAGEESEDEDWGDLSQGTTSGNIGTLSRLDDDLNQVRGSTHIGPIKVKAPMPVRSEAIEGQIYTVQVMKAQKEVSRGTDSNPHCCLAAGDRGMGISGQ
jgi:hypothetical protein